MVEKKNPSTDKVDTDKVDTENGKPETFNEVINEIRLLMNKLDDVQGKLTLAISGVGPSDETRKSAKCHLSPEDDKKSRQ